MRSFKSGRDARAPERRSRKIDLRVNRASPFGLLRREAITGRAELTRHRDDAVLDHFGAVFGREPLQDIQPKRLAAAGERD